MTTPSMHEHLREQKAADGVVRKAATGRVWMQLPNGSAAQSHGFVPSPNIRSESWSVSLLYQRTLPGIGEKHRSDGDAVCSEKTLSGQASIITVTDVIRPEYQN